MLKNGDFIKIEYTGYDKNGSVFDSTHGEISKKIRKREGPILVIYGKGQLLKGLEDAIKDVEVGKETEVLVSPEKAFGIKKKELVHVMKPDEFKKYNVAPKPGLTIHVDFEGGRMFGTIKSVTSGRIMIDFNHPLAGQTLKYKLIIKEIITDNKKKVELFTTEFGFKIKKLSMGKEEIKIEVEENKGIKDDELKKRKEALSISLKSLLPEIKKVFVK